MSKRSKLELSSESDNDYSSDEDVDYNSGRTRKGANKSKRNPPKRRNRSKNESDEEITESTSARSSRSKKALPEEESSISNRRTSSRRSEIAEKKAAALPFGGKWEKQDGLIIYDYPQTILPGNEKIAAFDMDSTLIKTKSGRVFPTGRDDWQWLFDSVPAKIQSAYKDGFKIIILTNQAGLESGNTQEEIILHKIQNILIGLNVPVQVFISAEKSSVYRKPSTGMWDFMVQNFNHRVQPNLEQSIYVGDAAGRIQGWNGNPKTKKDFSCADRKFAENVGVPFQTPEEYFLGDAPTTNFEYNSVNPVEIIEKHSSLTIFDDGRTVEEFLSKANGSQEVLLSVGFPASGKSTFAKRYLKEYAHINRDTLGTKQKCLAVAEQYLGEGKSVVIDNTNPSPDVRAEFIQLARKYNVPVRCLSFQTSFELAQHLNLFRERISGGLQEHVPMVAYHTFKKSFVAPDLAEGFVEVAKVNFIASFDRDEHSHIFKHRT